ncbi:MAG: endonuclease MutS2, partial [Thermodesulfovibrio sp.]|nr:endonuclease MutS2 [Thermodesulfovibrio sp.]
MTSYSQGLLEFDRLLGLVAAAAHSSVSGAAVLALGPLPDKTGIFLRQAQVREIMRMSAGGDPLRLSDFQDITLLLGKTRPEGAVLDPRELAAFIPVLSTVQGLSGQLSRCEDIPALMQLAGALTGCPELLKPLRKSVTIEGEILDTASLLLAEIRDRIRKLEARIRKRLEEMVREKTLEVFLQDDFITKRSGRWVIPVRMDAKGQVAGVVHDVSHSGETAFVEPLEIINSTNDLENLVAEQKTEEIRILRTLTSQVRNAADLIESEFMILVQLDLLHCIALFAEQHRMALPSIGDTGEINLIRARHPLLYAALKKTGRENSLVPLDVSLGRDSTVMVITGSNAGGKTIAIKTVGLLLLMALTGMPVPADEASQFPMVRNLLVDIGDDQSIENSLSTFSAHIENIARILENAGPGSLVLIDELGTGTDPEEGGALACAVLKELRSSGALVFATTHLADIKGFVHRTEGMLNASMEFDPQTLMPLYRLRKGEPGQSHALETARRYGLPDRIVASAKTLLSSNKLEFDNMVADLNLKRRLHEDAIAALGQQKSALQEKEDMLKQEQQAFELKYKEKLSEAYAKAAEIVRETKQQMQNLSQEFRKKEKEAGKEVLKQVRQKQAELEEKKREYARPDEADVAIGDISEGDQVFVKSLSSGAVVLKILTAQNRLRISFKGKEIELPISDVRISRGSGLPAPGGQVTAPAPDEMPSARLNLIGKRVEEALSELEPFLNHASLSGLQEVTVIHGFGTGVLSRAVRGHLKGHPL